MLGLCGGVLSPFAVLRKRGLMGDALAHAALPGICLAFMLTGERSVFWFTLGALAAGLVGAACIQTVTRYSRIKEDTALGLVLSVFFAVGIVLLTQILHGGGGTKAGLDKFLFGQAAAMTGSDVRVMTAGAGLVCFLALAMYKEFKLLCFDPGYADGLGFDSARLDALLNALIVVIVVLGLQAVGVVLVVAMLITPAAAARFWTHKLNRMVAVSGAVGALSGLLGAVFSALAPRMPTGPLIVLSATAMFLVSVVFAPERGALARFLRHFRLRKRVARENMLRAFYEMAESAGAWNRDFAAREIAARRGKPLSATLRALDPLIDGGDAESLGGNRFRLTEKGYRTAYQIVRNHRLWEMFLMHEGHLAADHVDRGADWIEHFLPPDTVGELERLLKTHGMELKLPPSVHPLDAA